MRNWRKWLAAAVLVFWAGVAFGQTAPSESHMKKMKDERELEREARRLDGEANTPTGEQRVLGQMSSQLGVPSATLEQQKNSSGLSFGNLFITDALAKSSGKSFDQILAERRSGKGWGEIARENNLRLGEVVSQLKRSSKSLEAERHEAEKQEARASKSEAAQARNQARGQAAGRPQSPRSEPATVHGGGPMPAGRMGGRRR